MASSSSSRAGLNPRAPTAQPPVLWLSHPSLPSLASGTGSGESLSILLLGLSSFFPPTPPWRSKHSLAISTGPKGMISTGEPQMCMSSVTSSTQPTTLTHTALGGESRVESYGWLPRAGSSGYGHGPARMGPCGGSRGGGCPWAQAAGVWRWWSGQGPGLATAG